MFTVNRKNREKGTSAVEFVLVLPLLLLMLFAIIEFSVAMYDKAVITNASREGARRGIVMRTPPPRISAAEISTTVANYSAAHLISFGAAAVTTSVSSICVDSGDQLTVTVSYPYNFFVVPNFLHSLTGTLILNGVTVMRCE
jgi:Flp pilus assembly protein TadG